MYHCSIRFYRKRQTMIESALLLLQNYVRKFKPYSYLEIGSYLGGTLQTHYADPLCIQIYSVDKRQTIVPDARRGTWTYRGSTQQMLDNLRKNYPDIRRPLKTFDCDASEINISEIIQPPNLMFIDGEHTDQAAFNDFQFCLKVKQPNSIIAFHDTYLVMGAIRQARGCGQKFKSFILTKPDQPVGYDVYVFLFGCLITDELDKFARFDEEEYFKAAKQTID